jgi:hypothetical protein
LATVCLRDGVIEQRAYEICALSELRAACAPVTYGLRRAGDIRRKRMAIPGRCGGPRPHALRTLDSYSSGSYVRMTRNASHWQKADAH